MYHAKRPALTTFKTRSVCLESVQSTKKRGEERRIDRLRRVAKRTKVEDCSDVEYRGLSSKVFVVCFVNRRANGLAHVGRMDLMYFRYGVEMSNLRLERS